MDRFPEIPGDFSWVGENKALATVSYFFSIHDVPMFFYNVNNH